jgi:peptidoglycan/LPS O-acetylase OafA/YrhL
MLAHFIFGGAYCVDIFFVLSGYVLSYAYENGFDQRRFFINRIARIFPLHIVMFTVAISELLFLQHSAILQNDVILKFSFSLLFYYSLTFVWFDMPDIMGTPTWSLSAEFFAYFFFPTVRRIDFRKYPTATAGLLAGLIVAQGLILSQIGFKATGFWALARALVGFGFGATLYFVKIPKELPNWLADAAMLWLVACVCAGDLGLAGLPTALLIRYLGEPGSSLLHRMLNHGAALWAGRISYSIYLVHAPLLVGAQILFYRTTLLSGSSIVSFTGAYFAILLGLSALTYRWIELPARNLIRRQTFRPS